jgi:hypothetical protein
MTQITFKGGAELERASRGLDNEIAGRLGLNAARGRTRSTRHHEHTSRPGSAGALHHALLHRRVIR